MKKGYYFFRKLSRNQRKEFRKEAKKQRFCFLEIMNDKHFRMSGFVVLSFDWYTSLQGLDYWLNVYNEYYE